MNYILHSAGDPTREGVRANLHSLIDKVDPRFPWEFTIKRYRREQTNDQLGARFGLAYAVMMEPMGLRGRRDKEWLHEFMCGEYWGWHPTIRNKPLRTTTTNERGEREVIDTAEAAKFWDFVVEWAARQIAVVIPDPNPFWKIAA